MRVIFEYEFLGCYIDFAKTTLQNIDILLYMIFGLLNLFFLN